jgi:beta-lactamase regulating signal transducer with metallopeptidase domain
MIASWMLYCCLCATGLSVAAFLAERALLAGRGPVRLVWIGAVVLSVLVPALAFRFAARLEPTPWAAQMSADIVPAPDATGPIRDNAPVFEAPRTLLPPQNWRVVLARIDGPLIIAWGTLSLAVAFNFLGGIVALAWMRRRWQRRSVLGVSVFVSERTGPAVVGALAPAIVLPAWALALERHQLALMLRHEQEHRRAGDGRLLAAAELALIVMPWNIALWWQVLRLRVAVELDCDARVLQDADARAYGDLLL